MSAEATTPTVIVEHAPLSERVLRILQAVAVRPHLHDPGWLSATSLAHEAGCDTPTALAVIDTLQAAGHQIERRPSFGAGMLRLAEHPHPALTGARS